ncbi:Protein of unknown function (DUF2752) [Abditibacterium utsteinense]|uniref:DUF2752 domain-containing protein n=1 Tax=Abditibacterium utsteinense TaxID=1960156 RepID=A0A2S8SU76_9BACT|nr:DUF2752 domain-containing protein [Abditibacterium utsteinense]PQV64357.1 Protein of unknown function (DUF2752) [Abditibacterium utsteinense]
MRIKPRFSSTIVVCALVLMTSALLPPPHNGAILGLPSICPFHNLSGLPCPACGLTRAFVCCAHGQLAAAFVYHPLGPILFGAASFFVGNALLNRPAPRISNRLLIFCAVFFGVFWVLRLLGVFPYPAA